MVIMAVIRPFCALRPHKNYVDQIAALPYDVMSTKEARAMVKDNPLSFLNIDRAEVNFPEPVDAHSPRVYAKARELLEQMIAKHQLIKDEQECLYIYRQIMHGRTQTGLVCCTAITDYLNNIIKKHEFTRPDKELDRVNHIEALNAHTGPIFQTYRTHPQITHIMNSWAATNSPLYKFTAYGVDQICWVIDNPSIIQQLVELFTKVKYLYIADGHHRSAAAFQAGMKKQQQNKKHSGSEEYNYFLSVLFPDSELEIMPYNRFVHDLNGMAPADFLAQIEQKFTVTQADKRPYQPQAKHNIGMYLEKTWYKLSPKPKLINPDDPIKSLDVAILQDHILDPILGIGDPRTNDRIEFIGGIRGLQELEKRVDEKERQVAFAMYQTSIEEIMAVADDNMVMPPKSTWFEPKLLCGLFIHQL